MKARRMMAFLAAFMAVSMTVVSNGTVLADENGKPANVVVIGGQIDETEPEENSVDPVENDFEGERDVISPSVTYITPDNFPDSAFRYYIANAIDNGDGVLTQDEIDFVTTLQDLKCNNTTLENLNISNSASIVTISVNGDTQLNSITVSGCPNLVSISGAGSAVNGVVAIDCPNLGDLYLPDTYMAVVDVTGSDRLVEVFNNPTSVEAVDGNVIFVNGDSRLVVTDGSIIIASHVPVIPALGDEAAKPEVQENNEVPNGDVTPSTDTPSTDETPTVETPATTETPAVTSAPTPVVTEENSSSPAPSVSGSPAPASAGGSSVSGAPAVKGDSAEEFVDRLYSVALGRASDEAGRKYWVDRLKNGVSEDEVVRDFLLSQEFLAKNTTDEQFIKTLYAAVFNRQADEEGMMNWMNSIESGVSREQIIKEFISSGEFKGLSDSFRIK